MNMDSQAAGKLGVEPLTTRSAENGTATSAKARSCARTALTHTQNDFERCANPFCDKERKIKPRGKHGRYCSPQCRMDVYMLKRAKAMLNRVGIVNFFSILEGV